MNYELPPLPEPEHDLWTKPGFTANQMREYARLALSRAQAVQPAKPAPAVNDEGQFGLALNVKHNKCYQAADAFWSYWNTNGETHKRGYYESTWGAINAAIKMVGVVPHTYGGKIPAAPLSQPAAAPVSKQTVPEGWKLVPIEPDLNMVIAGENYIGRHAWKRMLAAAPSNQSHGGDK